MVPQLFFLILGVPFGAAAQDAAATPPPAAPASFGRDSVRPIGLQEAVRLAQRNAPSAVQARGQIRTASSAVRSAYGAFVPSLTASLNQTKQSGERFDPLRNQVVTVTQPWSYRSGIGSRIVYSARCLKKSRGISSSFGCAGVGITIPKSRASPSKLGCTVNVSRFSAGSQVMNAFWPGWFTSLS